MFGGADANGNALLDPGMGLFYSDDKNRDSLACDLMEAVRPDVDAWVRGPPSASHLRRQGVLGGPGRALSLGGPSARPARRDRRPGSPLGRATGRVARRGHWPVENAAQPHWADLGRGRAVAPDREEPAWRAV
ncbi:MAG: CRISPR-associated endonuclease Cas1 [Candidatus Dormibacteria bacterium]